MLLLDETKAALEKAQAECGEDDATARALVHLTTAIVLELAALRSELSQAETHHSLH